MHHDDGIDAVAHRRLQLPDVIPHPAVPRPAHHRPVGYAALRAQRRRQPPAQRTRRPQIRLPRMMQLHHTPRPDAGVSRIRHQHRIRRQKVRQLLAQPFRAYRRRIGTQHASVFLPPVLRMLLRPRRPGRVAAAGFQHINQPFQRPLGIPQQPVSAGIRAPQLGGVKVNLHHRRAHGRQPPVQRNLAPRVAADEQHQVSLRHHPVGRPPRVAAHHAHRQRVVFGDASLGVERRRHRNIQHLRQPHHLRLRPRSRHAAPGHNNRTRRLRQPPRRLPHPLRLRFRAERRPLRKGLLHDDIRIQNAVGNHIPGNARKIQMRRQRLPGGNLPERLPQQMRQLLHRLHLGAVLGNRRERPRVLNFLVGIAVPVHRRAVAGDGDDRRHPQVGIL